jgi:hypothetical protein
MSRTLILQCQWTTENTRDKGHNQHNYENHFKRRRPTRKQPRTTSVGNRRSRQCAYCSDWHSISSWWQCNNADAVWLLSSSNITLIMYVHSETHCIHLILQDPSYIRSEKTEDIWSFIFHACKPSNFRSKTFFRHGTNAGLTLTAESWTYNIWITNYLSNKMIKAIIQSTTCLLQDITSQKRSLPPHLPILLMK